MSITIFPFSKPGKETTALNPFGHCCGMHPVVITWPKEILVGVICRNADCPNSVGVLGYDVDIKAKWEQYRNPGTAQEGVGEV